MATAQEELQALQTNNTADAASLSVLEAAVNAAAEPTVGDDLLSLLVQHLVEAGYTVNPPVAPVNEPAPGN